MPSIVAEQAPISISIAVGAHAEADIDFGTIAATERVVITGIYIHSTAGAAGVLTIRTAASGDSGVPLPIPLLITLDSKQLSNLRWVCAWGDKPTRTYSAALVSGSITITFTWVKETR